MWQPLSKSKTRDPFGSKGVNDINGFFVPRHVPIAAAWNGNLWVPAAQSFKDCAMFINHGFDVRKSSLSVQQSAFRRRWAQLQPLSFMLA